MRLPKSNWGKLNDTEWKYTVQEKEMTAIVHCLRTWRHYLLGSKFTIRTDKIATSYFQIQKKLSSKQARWQDLLLADCLLVGWIGYQPVEALDRPESVSSSRSAAAEHALLARILDQVHFARKKEGEGRDCFLHSLLTYGINRIWRAMGWKRHTLS